MLSQTRAGNPSIKLAWHLGHNAQADVRPEILGTDGGVWPTGGPNAGATTGPNCPVPEYPCPHTAVGAPGATTSCVTAPGQRRPDHTLPARCSLSRSA